ncbi:MAG: DUF488 domain-containing protein [Acidobacteria bacterium]|nr:DUF488 domain-containing protein [Acidobacteriota bacterium]
MSSPPPTLWTLGHSTRTLEELIHLLTENEVSLLVDIRSFPGSARFPHFARESLETRLPEVGIEYRWLGKELGGYRKKREPNSPHTALRSPGFRNYADHMATEEFQRGVQELEKLAAGQRVAILCAERLWWRCHRSFVSDYLMACRGWQVIHLLEADKPEPHRLHRAARCAEGRLLYDVEERPTLFPPSGEPV